MTMGTDSLPYVIDEKRNFAWVKELFRSIWPKLEGGVLTR